MAATTSISLSDKSQQAFMTYYNTIQDLVGYTRSSVRSRYEEVDIQYQREEDLTKDKIDATSANKRGDASRYQDIVVPVIMPQVEAAVVYQASVFLTGSPLFGVVAHPQYIDEALQLETKIDDDSIRNGWVRELLMFFRDGFKYNFSAVEVAWSKEVTSVPVTNTSISATTGVAKETLWSGNVIKRLDPYNTFIDPRVAPTEVYKKGEFAGYTEFMTRIELKALLASLDTKIIRNIKPAFESTSAYSSATVNAESKGYYRPVINRNINESDYLKGGMNWLAWAGIDTGVDNKIQYNDTYEVTTLYCRVMPSEFSINTPKQNTPQIYKLLIINHSVIVYAELQTNAHNNIPIFVGMPYEDGLNYQTKSYAEDSAPFQSLATTYMKSIIASRRRAISDRALFDPSRITSAHINSDNPSAKIPVRPSAYNTDIKQAVYPFPYREDQAGNDLQQIQAILGLANSLAGQNQASQGQFVKGNKTLHEFESVMQHANGRDQLVSILLEHQVFMPIKHVLKINILQYQGGVTLFNRDKKTEVQIDPVALRKAVLNFRVSDGLIPSSKLVNADTLSVALQVLGSSPSIAKEYNIGPLFSYLMKTQGAAIVDFEKSREQIAYEQALGVWQQVAMEYANKGMEFKQPQPTPEQFGYNVATSTPSGRVGTNNLSGNTNSNQ